MGIGRAEDAKESLMEALTIDYKDVDMLKQLIGGEMMKVSISQLYSHRPSGS